MWTLKRICSLEQAGRSDPREGGIPPPTLSTEWSGWRECTPTSYSPTTFQPEDLFFGLVGVLDGLPAERGVQLQALFPFSVLPSSRLADTKVGREKGGGAGSHIPMRPL